MSIIQVKDLSFAYNKNEKQVLNNVSLTLEEGEVMTILGPNGAGKSTLLNCIATLLTPDKGSVSLCGKDAKDLKPKDVAKIIRNKDIAHQFSCHLASFHIPVAHTHVTQVAQRYGASFGIRAALSHASGKSLGYRLYRKAF